MRKWLTCQQSRPAKCLKPLASISNRPFPLLELNKMHLFLYVDQKNKSLHSLPGPKEVPNLNLLKEVLSKGRLLNWSVVDRSTKMTQRLVETLAHQGRMWSKDRQFERRLLWSACRSILGQVTEPKLLPKALPSVYERVKVLWVVGRRERRQTNGGTSTIIHIKYELGAKIRTRTFSASIQTSENYKNINVFVLSCAEMCRRNFKFLI